MSTFSITSTSNTVNILIERHGLVITRWVEVHDNVYCTICGFFTGKSGNFATFPDQLREIGSVVFEFTLDVIVILDLIVAKNIMIERLMQCINIMNYLFSKVFWEPLIYLAQGTVGPA